MKIIKFSKRLKNVLGILIDNKIQLAISLNVIDNTNEIRWATLEGKQTVLTTEQEEKYKKAFNDYAKTTKQYKEIINKYK